METRYDEETHKYYVNGIETPSVTEICEPISFKRLDALEKNILERARARGSRCHELFEQYLLLGELDVDEIETEWLPYVQQFALWVKTYKPKVMYTEKKLFSTEFSGTCDLIAEVDGKLLLVDYKTTSVADKKSLSVQLEGYYRLCQQHGIDIQECWYLHIKKDSYVFKPITRNARWFDVLLEHNTFMRSKYNE